MTQPDFTPCACLGSINGEPHCPCAMKQLGLPRHPEPQITPEALERLQIREWAQLCERQEDVIELNPATVIALLDRLESAEKALAEPVVEPVAWMVRNGLVDYQLMGSKTQADALAAEMQKRHDLSGSWSSFRVHPLYASPSPPPPAEVPMLTQAEINEIDTSEFWDDHTPQDFARAIEALVRQRAGLK